MAMENRTDYREGDVVNIGEEDSFETVRLGQYNGSHFINSKILTGSRAGQTLDADPRHFENSRSAPQQPGVPEFDRISGTPTYEIKQDPDAELVPAHDSDGQHPSYVHLGGTEGGQPPVAGKEEAAKAGLINDFHETDPESDAPLATDKQRKNAKALKLGGADEPKATEEK